MLFFKSLPSVTVAEAQRRAQQPGAVLLDVRTPEEYAGGHAKGALNRPLQELDSHLDELKKYTEVYTLCNSGGRSSRATQMLRQAGVRALNVTGGTNAWREQGLPME